MKKKSESKKNSIFNNIKLNDNRQQFLKNLAAKYKISNKFIEKYDLKNLAAEKFDFSQNFAGDSNFSSDFDFEDNFSSKPDFDTELLGVTAVIAEMISATKNQASTDHKHPSKHRSNNLIKVLLDTGSDGDLMFHEKGTYKRFPLFDLAGTKVLAHVERELPNQRKS